MPNPLLFLDLPVEMLPSQVFQLAKLGRPVEVWVVTGVWTLRMWEHSAGVDNLLQSAVIDHLKGFLPTLLCSR